MARKRTTKKKETKSCKSSVLLEKASEIVASLEKLPKPQQQNVISTVELILGLKNYQGY